VSIELVLLIVAFVLLPLAQMLVRAARAGEEPQPAQPAATPSSVDAPRWQEEQFLELEDDTVPDVTVTPEPEPEPARYPTRPPTPPIRRERRRATVAVSLRNPLDLRRAIVLRTVLGPCRANQPPDGPEGAAGR
jgi:hypothetical protein